MLRNIYSLILPFMRSTLTSDILQRRRMRAAKLYGEGWTITDIAQALQVSPAAVSQWMKAYKQHGAKGLESTPKTGASPRLTKRHQLLLRALLVDTPRDHGINADTWTRELVQKAIKRLFGVSFSIQHVGRLMKNLSQETSSLPSVTRLELKDLIKKSDIARIRSRITESHGKRRR
jgi:transposase